MEFPLDAVWVYGHFVFIDPKNGFVIEVYVVS